MMDAMLYEPFERLLTDESTMEVVRRIERDGDGAALWTTIAESGFADALVPESAGGAGLPLPDVAPLLIAAGRHLLPVPFADTMIARALIAEAGQQAPTDGPILLWPATDDGRIRSLAAPAASGAGYALVQQGTTVTLRALGKASETRDGFGMLEATVDRDGAPLLSFSAEEDMLLGWAAAVTASAMAGALSGVLDLSLTHVNDRQQFGRPLAKFQAIQQQMSVLAEHVVSAGMAVHLSFSGTIATQANWRAAVGKTVAARAAGEVSAIAHAVHGAIGISEEHDLQLYTRHLKRWQLMFGSGKFWAQRIGKARLASNAVTTVDFIREPAPAGA